MSFETIRINELAKELGLTSKEVIEKFAQLSITGKTHSSTVTVDQVKRLKEFIASGGVKEAKKPKAFVVKKAKTPDTVTVEEPKEENKVEVKKVSVPKVEVVRSKPQSRLEIVRRAPQRPAAEKQINRQNPGNSRLVLTEVREANDLSRLKKTEHLLPKNLLKNRQVKENLYKEQ